jgi:hypothetical protein
VGIDKKNYSDNAYVYCCYSILEEMRVLMLEKQDHGAIK